MLDNTKPLEKNEILLYNNDVAEIIRKTIISDTSDTIVYNLEIEDNHTYFVGEAGLLVHNECHHIVSNKGKKGKSTIKRIKETYPDFDANNPSNTVMIDQHKGRHADDYHTMVSNVTDKFISESDDLAAFYEKLEGLGKNVKENYLSLGKGGKSSVNDILEIYNLPKIE